MTKTLTNSNNQITIDARGPRFGALLTTIVLATTLITHNIYVLAFQALVFAIGAFRGPQYTPYAFIFKNFVRPRLSSEGEQEDVRPPKFAQLVGFGFAVVALIGALTGVTAIFTVAVSFAFVAAFLNFAFNFCLGCVIYLRITKLVNRA